MMQEFKFQGYGDTPIHVYLWDDVIAPKGVVQMSHGMTEHCGRYDAFARFLNSKGYIVFGDDHRCHGKTEPDETRGHHKGDTWADTLEDLVMLHNHFHNLYKDLPIFFIGHSYGSFLGQAFLQRHTNISGAVLLGSAHMGEGASALATIGLFPIWLLASPCRPRFINKGSDLLFNGKYKPEKGPHLWITRDPVELENYDKDPLLNINTSINFCWRMMNGLRKAYTKTALSNLDPLVPILVLSGDMDPIGGYGKKSEKLFKTYQNQGLDVSFKLYPGARHELLREINKEEVYQDILNFLDQIAIR